ncbi:hypothetical protein HH214_03645 [Mucilaginibacter robiniae]|uniref:Uncharacterized protein n=1 Tax=Mucilaginibacter robiniae TaxID=2728022 RepID=A0A7L5E3W3_9SPHI|nr:hypothetical protein [Mucilaginibacter robiniae]QJD95036.1 hypothetical protein HH214_03645 [Mucilaginibacter robiniae]
MTYTTVQAEGLKKYLRSILRYRETYEEVYDHVLTALTAKPDSISFEEAVNTILKDDFGGANSLPDMEKRCHKAVMMDMLRKQWFYVKAYFISSKIIFTILLTLATYSLVVLLNASNFIWLWLYLILTVLVTLIIMIRYFSVGYYFKDTKRSIRDKISEEIAGRPLFFYNMGVMFLYSTRKQHYKSLPPVDPFLLTAFIVINVIYILSFIRLSQDEFQLYITK